MAHTPCAASPSHAGKIVRTPRGEAIEWDVDEPYETGTLVLLCRCGRSKTKPFCDDSHLEGFDGTEVADRGPTRRSPRVVPRGRADAHRRRGALLARGLLPRPPQQRLGAHGDDRGPGGPRQGGVRSCSGARRGDLVLLDEHGEAIEAAFAPSVVVEQNGPYVIRGGVLVESADGRVWETRNRMTLCRCGQSSNKPFCDATHERSTGGSSERSGWAPLLARMTLPPAVRHVGSPAQTLTREWRNLADALDLGSSARKGVGVQISPLARPWNRRRRTRSGHRIAWTNDGPQRSTGLIGRTYDAPYEEPTATGVSSRCSMRSLRLSGPSTRPGPPSRPRERRWREPSCCRAVC